MKETSKCAIHRGERGDFDRFLTGRGIDIGCGDDRLVVPNGAVEGWDFRREDAQLMAGVVDGAFDFVYSSHCLEHMRDVREAIFNWLRILRPGGHLYLVVPDYVLYEKMQYPSIFNGDHKQTFSLSLTRDKVRRPNHWHIESDLSELARKELGATTMVSRLEDQGYDYNLPPSVDQTFHPATVAQICVVMRKEPGTSDVERSVVEQDQAQERAVPSRRPLSVSALARMGHAHTRMKPKKLFCFVVSSSYWKQGKLAIESALRWNPGWEALVLTDAQPDLNVTAVGHEELALKPNWWPTTGRAAICRYALERCDAELMIFLDGDTFTYGPFLELEEQLRQGASLVVTPHILRPLPNDGLIPSFPMLSLMGNYNSGVLAATPRGLGFLRWWDEQTRAFPQLEPHTGIASEQGWLRYALDFDPNAALCRHPGYNAAYWNIVDRPLSRDVDGRYLVDGLPLRVFHFSGLRKDLAVSRMSVYQNRYSLVPGTPIHGLYAEYQSLLCSRLAGTSERGLTPATQELEKRRPVSDTEQP